MQDLIDITENIQLKLAKQRGILKCANYVGGKECDVKDDKCPNDCCKSPSQDRNITYK